MPRVPVEQNRVGIAEVTDAKFRPADGAGAVLQGIGQGMQALGGAGMEAARVQDRINDRLDETGAKALDVEYITGRREIRERYLASKGLNAGAERLAAEKELRTFADKIRARAKTPGMKDMLGQVLSARIASDLDDFGNHAATQLDQAHAEGSQSRWVASAEEATAALTWEAREMNIDTGVGEIRRYGAEAGWESSVTDGKVFTYRSSIHRTVADGLIDADKIDDATAYARDHANELSAKDEGAIWAALKAPLQRRETVGDADGIMGAATAGTTSATVSYADPLRGAGRTPVPGGQFGAPRDYGSHHGVDMPSRLGTAVHAAAPGVAHVSTSANGGNIVTVKHDDGSVSKYMHLDGFKVKDGERVTPDTILGGVGMTGRSTGPHLHYEMWQNGKPVAPDKVAAGVQQAPQRHDLNELLARVDTAATREGWTPERRDRLKQEVQQRVGRDEALLARQEDDASRAATEVITRLGDGYTSIGQIPANIRRGLAPATLASLTDQARHNAAPNPVAANGAAAVALHTAANLSPDEFKRTNLATLKHLITSAEYDQIATLQSAMIAKPNSSAQASHSAIWGMISRFAVDVGLDLGTKGGKPNKPEDRAASMRLFSIMQGTLQTITEGKRAPSDDEIKKAFDNAVMPVAHEKAGWFGRSAEMAPRFRDATLPTNSVAVPSADFARIQQLLRERKLPSDAQSVSRWWLQNRQ